MKFAQLLSNHTIAQGGGSVRSSFSAENVQGIILMTNASTGWDDLYLNVNVGSNFMVARCSISHLLKICSFNKGFSNLGASAGAIFVDLGSIFLKTNEELEIYLTNDSSTTDKTTDLSVVYNCDYPANQITYQNIVDSNFSRDNISQIWGFGTGDLAECTDVITLQNAFGSQSTAIKVFNQWTNTQSNQEQYDDKCAQLYADPDGILTKVTASVTDMSGTNSVKNFIVVANDTPIDVQEEFNAEYIKKKEAKLASLGTNEKRLNRLKGLL